MSGVGSWVFVRACDFLKGNWGDIRLGSAHHLKLGVLERLTRLILVTGVKLAKDCEKHPGYWIWENNLAALP